jgi:hypothetical protein
MKLPYKTEIYLCSKWDLCLIWGKSPWPIRTFCCFILYNPQFYFYGPISTEGYHVASWTCWRSIEEWTTDKRTDVWSRDFIIWNNQFWAVGRGLGWTVKKKGLGRLWATFEARFFTFFRIKKLFWKHYSVSTEKSCIK